MRRSKNEEVGDDKEQDVLFKHSLPPPRIHKAYAKTKNRKRIKLQWTLVVLIGVYIVVTVRTAYLYHQAQQQTEVVVCMHGEFFGQTFNRFFSLAHAWWYAAHPNSHSGGDSSVLRLPAQDLAWYQEWLDLPPSNDSTFLVQAYDPSTAHEGCTTSLDYQQWFYYDDSHPMGTKGAGGWWGAYTTHRLQEQQPVRAKRPDGYQPSLNLLRTALKESYQRKAKLRLQHYQKHFAANQQKSSHSIHPDDVRVVTVHARSLENQCRTRIQDASVFCSNINQLSPDILRKFEQTCDMTQSFVQHHLQPVSEVFPFHQTLILLFSDGQSPAVESTFDIVDDAPFAVQVAMMVQSDYHFGCPASSIDAMVAHWRQGKPIFPNKCYKGILEHYPNATILPDGF